jgi:hypothetical protein
MQQYFQRSTAAAPLAVFRIMFGLLIFGSMVRFWGRGWIEQLYIKPKYFFPFYGLEFVKPLGENIYIIFAICAISGLMVAFGFYYRMAATALFLSFTYVEMIDKSTYLNHYYFVSMVSLLMIFLPAHAYFSIDAYRNKNLLSDRIPAWTLDSLKFFVGLTYFFAGLAKINSDWLIHAIPLRIWLPAKNDTLLIGPMFNHLFVAYAFSWLGCIYDLSIPFLLRYRKTRPFAYSAVIIFHILTAILFPIGMFPYIMISVGLLFFSAEFHQRIIRALAMTLKLSKEFLSPDRIYQYKVATSKILIAMFIVFFVIQLTVPLRYLLYPGELFWTEEGYRFSWRVMLMEKAGHAQFIVRDSHGRHAAVDNAEFLTTLQEKMMATQPDMILQYAHILRDHYQQNGFESPRVYVDSYVALNGRIGRQFIDPNVNLASERESFKHKSWILPFQDDIKGF